MDVRSTPLHLAARKGRMREVLALIHNKADANAVDSAGCVFYPAVAFTLFLVYRIALV